MQALVFLTVRSLVNGIKRALTSGRRLIGLIFFVGYYSWLVFRPMTDQPSRFNTAQAFPPSLSAPPLGVLDAVVFAMFAFMSFILVMNVTGYRGGFRPADVDVLFATPVSPRLVLVFRIVRDYLLTLFLPLLFAIIGWRGLNDGMNLFRSQFTDQQIALTFRAMAVSWILMALCWVSIGYAASLFVNRSDLQSDRNKRIIVFSIGAILILASCYAGYMVRQSPTWETAQALAHSPIFRAVFFTATAATAFVMAPLENNLLQGLFGIGGLFAIIVGAFTVAMTQVGWLYDQAAAKGFDAQSVRNLRQKGDMYGILAEQARQGKLKQGRLARWIARWSPKGAMALLWKDLILQARGSMWSYVVFTPIAIFMVAMPVWAVSKSDRATVVMYFVMQGFAVFMMSMSANSGVIEMLRRVDVQKPLPFSPTLTVFWEIAAKAIPPSLIAWLAGLVALVIKPDLLEPVIATTLMAPSLAFLLVSVVYLVTILFPDVDDPTQRGFRSLMLLLGLTILGSPAVGLFTLLAAGVPGILAPQSPIVAAIPFIGVNVAVTIGISLLSGLLYSNFNPAE